MFSQACVKNSVHGGAGGACMAGGGRLTWQERRPLQWMVHILLECILVLNGFHVRLGKLQPLLDTKNVVGRLCFQPCLSVILLTGVLCTAPLSSLTGPKFPFCTRSMVKRAQLGLIVHVQTCSF